ncbi:LuxR superfamily regulatory protein, partial [Burkholderia sp. TJI49]
MLVETPHPDQETTSMRIAAPPDPTATHDGFDDAAWTARELSAWLGLVYQGPSEATPWAGFLEAIRVRL